MSKELHRIKGWSIGVFDDDNYYYAKIGVVEKGDNAGKEKLADIKYSRELYKAIQAVADQVARKEAKDLRSFLESLQRTLTDIQKALTPRSAPF